MTLRKAGLRERGVILLQTLTLRSMPARLKAVGDLWAGVVA